MAWERFEVHHSHINLCIWLQTIEPYYSLNEQTTVNHNDSAHPLTYHPQYHFQMTSRLIAIRHLYLNRSLLSLHFQP